MRISVVGLGKLGSPMAAVFAAHGHEVIGLDVNTSNVEALRAGRAPVDEPKLQATIDAGRARLSATSDWDELSEKSDITFIVVPTPSDAAGAFSNEYILAVLAKLGAALGSKHAYHVVAITSTVMPGSMDGPIRRALESASGRAVGTDVGLCYNPEFIALGSVIDNMLEPDFILIGESDSRAGALLAAVYETVCLAHPPTRRMNLVNAEIAKISVNTFVTTKISYANMLADLCERLPGADVEVVAEAVGSDSRVGRKYLRGAIGYGGPCFPRDNVAFATLAARVGAHADLARATDAINRYQIDRLQAAVTKRVPAGARVAVLGMTYKPYTNVLDESQGLMLAKRLREAGYSVTIHDPVAGDAAARLIGADVKVATSPENALADADVAVIATPWPIYAELGRANLTRRTTVIDCWRMVAQAHGSLLDIAWLGYGEPVRVSSAR